MNIPFYHTLSILPIGRTSHRARYSPAGILSAHFLRPKSMQCSRKVIYSAIFANVVIAAGKYVAANSLDRGIREVPLQLGS